MRDYHPDDYERRENPVHDAPSGRNFIPHHGEHPPPTPHVQLSDDGWRVYDKHGNHVITFPNRDTALAMTRLMPA